MNALPYVFTALILWWALWTAYWFAVRRPLLSQLKRYIDSLRTTLADEMSSCQQGEGYELVMSRLSWTVEELEEVSLSALTRVDFSKVKPGDYEKYHRAILNSPPAVRIIHIKLVLAVTGAFALNSPFVVFLFSGLVLAFAWTAWFRKNIILLGDVILGRHAMPHGDTTEDKSHSPTVLC